MKRIINGLTYNTETATRVADWDEGYGGDFHKVTEAIYVSKKGRWFRAGSGGPASMYAIAEGNAYRGGSGLFPLTEDDAMLILEQRNQTEELATHFSHLIQEA